MRLFSKFTRKTIKVYHHFAKLFLVTNIFFQFLGGSLVSAQQNVSFVSNIDYQTLHNANLNDVWGYVDEQGNEYAIVGTTLGTSVVDLSNPSNPVEIFWLPGEESIWRDPKVYGDYAYITTEAEEGLTIIDLSPLPQSPIVNTILFTGPIGNSWTAAHNCYADSSGYLYVFGANRGNGGIIIYDLNPDPMNPQELGEFDTWYCHDGMVRNDTLFAGHIYDGIFSIIDVSNKTAPILLGNQFSPGFFAHNIWPSTSGSTVFTTDEISAGKIGSFDITDVNNMNLLDIYQCAPGTGVIPHNVFVKGEHIIASHYTEGIIILDASFPDNLIQVGQYDTYPTQSPNYEGCWGVYPYLPSGLILASDMTEGLFILNPTYKKAAYLGGSVYNSMDLNSIANVEISLESNDQMESSNFQGDYYTGSSTSGTVNVDFFKVGYFPKTESVQLFEDSLVVLDVFLDPIPDFYVEIEVRDASTLLPISGAKIKLVHPLVSNVGTSNGIGQGLFNLYYQENYELIVGMWGYKTNCQTVYIDSTTLSLTVLLERGFYDDFEFDFGWTVIGDAETGQWERGIPFPTNSTVLGNDADFDCGDFCYITGNSNNLDPDFDDIDNGTTTLISPNFNFNGFSTPYINYSIAYYCFYGPGLVDDTLKIILSNGSEQVVIDQFIPPISTMEWVDRSIAVPSTIALNNSMNLILQISDLNPNVNVTEVMFDRFYTSNNSTESITEQSNKLVLYPNPTSDWLQVLNAPNIGCRIYTSTGELVKTFTDCMYPLNVSELNSGVYFIQLNENYLKFIKK